MLTNSQKEHLTYTAVGQVFVMLIACLYIFQSVIPGISAINAKKSATQAIISEYNSQESNGIEFSNLSNIITNKPELIKIIQSDPTNAKAIIKKTDGVDKPYLDWIKGEIGKTDEEKKNLIIEKAKLNSIIPTMSPISNSIDESNITLKQYVNFIEKTILKQFNFDSNVVIGMQGIVFGDGEKVPKNLGMFTFQLDFKGTNGDIMKFIEYINKAGKPDILSFTGNLASDQVPLIMSNPLITMESFSIQEKLNLDNPTGENSGRASLKFYVRGISKDDITFLKDNLKTRQETLKKNIDEIVKFCTNTPDNCVVYGKKLTAFQQKYLEYSRASEGAKISLGGTDEIYALNQAINTLKSLEQEFASILPKTKTN